MRGRSFTIWTVGGHHPGLHNKKVIRRPPFVKMTLLVLSLKSDFYTLGSPNLPLYQLFRNILIFSI